jgi:hypothetical protein
MAATLMHAKIEDLMKVVFLCGPPRRLLQVKVFLSGLYRAISGGLRGEPAANYNEVGAVSVNES